MNWVRDGDLKGKNVYLTGLLRQWVEYRALKRAVREQQNLYGATTVLIEDKASDTRLIQDLIADGCYGVTRCEERGVQTHYSTQPAT
jgi:hypothetical protein